MGASAPDSRGRGAYRRASEAPGLLFVTCIIINIVNIIISLIMMLTAALFVFCLFAKAASDAPG